MRNHLSYTSYLGKTASLLGSSTLNIPFAFPSSAVADAMTKGGAFTTSDRANQLLVFYWDGIDEGALEPITGNMGVTASSTVNYLVKKGASRMEAAAFVNAMISLPDKSWLFPKWSLTKTFFQDATGTGAQGSGGSKTVDIQKWLWIGGGLLLAYGIVTTGVSAWIGKKS